MENKLLLIWLYVFIFITGCTQNEKKQTKVNVQKPDKLKEFINKEIIRHKKDLIFEIDTQLTIKRLGAKIYWLKEPNPKKVQGGEVWQSHPAAIQLIHDTIKDEFYKIPITSFGLHHVFNLKDGIRIIKDKRILPANYEYKDLEAFLNRGGAFEYFLPNINAIDSILSFKPFKMLRIKTLEQFDSINKNTIAIKGQKSSQFNNFLELRKALEEKLHKFSQTMLLYKTGESFFYVELLITNRLDEYTRNKEGISMSTIDSYLENDRKGNFYNLKIVKFENKN